MRTTDRARRGITLVELVIALLLIGVLTVGSIDLIRHFLRTIVYLPRAVAANQVSAEVLRQLIEGGPSGLGVGGVYGPATEVRGLRYAVRGAAGEGAVWLAMADQVGFRTSDHHCVAMRVIGGTFKRSAAIASPATPCRTVPLSGEEDIPPDALGGVTLSAPTGRFFRYYNQGGNEVPDGSPPGGTVRRVDITFVAQTGNGSFQDGEARANRASAVTIRVP